METQTDVVAIMDVTVVDVTIIATLVDAIMDVAIVDVLTDYFNLKSLNKKNHLMWFFNLSLF